MSGHINLQTSWVSALLERAITGSGEGKKTRENGILQGFIFAEKEDLFRNAY